MNFDADIRANVNAFSSKEGVASSMVEGLRQEGAFKGQQVVQTDATSALADAAEEMSFAAAEKVEKRLAERKAGSKETLKLSATELADKYVNMMGKSQPSHKLHEFLDALKKKGENISEQEIRQMVKEQFQDVSEQYAALAFAEEALLQDPEQAVLASKVSQVKELLMKEAGSAIRAGLNIAGDVLSFSKQGLEQMDKLRDLYRYAILGRQTVSDMYQAIMSRYGENRFGQALDFLIQAAGNDLDANGLGPSMEPAHLESAVNNINYVQQMGQLYQSLADLITRVTPQQVGRAY